METGGVGVTVAPGNPDYLLLAAAGYSLYPMHDSLRLLDAHLIFEPLLSSLGVMPQQMISTGQITDYFVLKIITYYNLNLRKVA